MLNPVNNTSLWNLYDSPTKLRNCRDLDFEIYVDNSQTAPFSQRKTHEKCLTRYIRAFPTHSTPRFLRLLAHSSPNTTRLGAAFFLGHNIVMDDRVWSSLSEDVKRGVQMVLTQRVSPQEDPDVLKEICRALGILYQRNRSPNFLQLLNSWIANPNPFWNQTGLMVLSALDYTDKSIRSSIMDMLPSLKSYFEHGDFRLKTMVWDWLCSVLHFDVEDEFAKLLPCGVLLVREYLNANRDRDAMDTLIPMIPLMASFPRYIYTQMEVVDHLIQLTLEDWIGYNIRENVLEVVVRFLETVINDIPQGMEDTIFQRIKSLRDEGMTCLLNFYYHEEDWNDLEGYPDDLLFIIDQREVSLIRYNNEEGNFKIGRSMLAGFAIILNSRHRPLKPGELVTKIVEETNELIEATLMDRDIAFLKHHAAIISLYTLGSMVMKKFLPNLLINAVGLAADERANHLVQWSVVSLCMRMHRLGDNCLREFIAKVSFDYLTKKIEGFDSRVRNRAMEAREFMGDPYAVVRSFRAVAAREIMGDPYAVVRSFRAVSSREIMRGRRIRELA